MTISELLQIIDEIETNFNELKTEALNMDSIYRNTVSNFKSNFDNIIDNTNQLLVTCNNFDSSINNDNQYIKQFISIFKTYLTPEVSNYDSMNHMLQYPDDDIPVLSDITDNIKNFPKTISNVIGELLQIITYMYETIQEIQDISYYTQQIVELCDTELNKIAQVKSNGPYDNDDIDFLKSFILRLNIDSISQKFENINLQQFINASQNLNELISEITDIPVVLTSQINNFNTYINTYFGYLDQLRRSVQVTVSAGGGC